MAHRADHTPTSSSATVWCRGGLAWWVLWSVLALFGAAGLPRLHVNNSLSAWAPKTDSTQNIANYIVVGIEPSATDLAALEQALRQHPSVAVCVGPASQPFLRAAGIPPESLVLSDDHRFAGIYCFAKPGVQPDQFYNDIQRTLLAHGRSNHGAFALGGSAAYAAALNDATQRRMPLIVSCIILAGGFMLWWLARSARAAASGLAAISLSMAILLGGIGWLAIDVDMSLLLVPPLMISLGYSYAAHAALRRDATPALTACVTTTVLGVAAFGTTDLPSIRAFALFGSIGVVLVWLCVISLVPGPRSTVTQDTIDRVVRRAILLLVRRASPAIILVALLVSTAGAWLSPGLSVDAQPLHYFAPSERLVRDNAVLERRLTGTLPFEVLAPPGIDAARVIRREAVIRAAVDVSFLAGCADRDIWCLADNDALDTLQDVFQRWSRDDVSGASRFQLRGVAPQLLEVRHQMRRVAAVSIPCMLAIAGLATWLLSRSFLAGFAAILVNLVPVAAVVSLGVAFGWTCQMPTLMVGAIGIGAGIDDAIHVVWLHRRCSLVRALRVCLRACAGSSAIAAICLATLSLSPFAPTSQFGLLMALVLALAAVADMVVLPAIVSMRC